MTLETLRETLPEYAKDIKLNLGNVLTVEGAPDLTINQINGVALTSAYTTRNPEIIRHLEQHAKAHISTAEEEAAKAASVIMAMNNIYYRFIHLVHDEELSKMPARLRMNVIGNSGIAKVDFELYSLAASAINGCGMCMEAHVHEVIKGGISKQGIQSVIRIAAVINAAAQAVEIKLVG